MGYQVIARKWRPALFEEVIGQESVVRTLKNAVSSGRVGHAYLFSGPRGVGKTTIARIFAKCLNCVKGPASEPCNACGMCKAITSGHSVDVLEIDGASNTDVDNIRELRESVKYAPAEGKYKIYIIDEVHMLSKSAFNALLKTLEEPPPFVVFMFATTEPNKIPMTIHSRCQRFDFKRVPVKKIHDRLIDIAKKEGIKASDDALYLMAREAEGSMRDGQSLLEQVISFSGASIGREEVLDALGLMDRTVIFNLCEALLKKDAKACLNIVEKMHVFGYDFKKVITELLEQVRDLAVIKVTNGASFPDLPESEMNILRDMAGLAGLERLQLQFSVLSKGYEELVRSTTPRYSLEMTLLKALHTDDVTPMSEIISKIDALKGGSATPAPLVKKTFAIEKPATEVKENAPAVDCAPVNSRPLVKPDAVSPDAPDVAVKTGQAVSPLPTPLRGTPTGSGGIADVIPDFLDYLKERDRLTFNRLESQTVRLEGGTLIVEAGADGFGFLQVKKDILSEAAEDFFKKKMIVVVNKREDSKPTKKTVALPSSGKDPVVMDAVTTLGAKLIDERIR